MLSHIIFPQLVILIVTKMKVRTCKPACMDKKFPLNHNDKGESIETYYFIYSFPTNNSDIVSVGITNSGVPVDPGATSYLSNEITNFPSSFI